MHWLMMRKMHKIADKFRIWEALVDGSFYFALAGLKAQGFSDKEAKERLRARWRRAMAEHAEANRTIARRMSGQRT